MTRPLKLKWKKAQGLADTASGAVMDAVDGETPAVRERGRGRMLRFLEMMIEEGGDKARGRRGDAIARIAEYVEEHVTSAGAVAVNEDGADRDEVRGWQDVVEAMAQQLRGEPVVVTKTGVDSWDIVRASVVEGEAEEARR